MSTATIERQAPAALHAITQHIVDQCLPAPMAIDFDAEGIEVTILSADAPRWLATIHVDDRTTERRDSSDHSHAYYCTRHPVRLPATGVGFRIRYLHRDPLSTPATTAVVGSHIAPDVAAIWNRAAAPSRVHAADWHTRCDSDDACTRTVCFNPTECPDESTVPSSRCMHGRRLCEDHARECPECLGERRADGRF